MKQTKIESLFDNLELFEQALTHRSWINEHKYSAGTNERLEFLGDAVLELVVSAEIYERFPDKEEGYLTALRASLVNTENLANVATKLGLGKLIKLSKGEEVSGGRANPSLLADTTEAVIGALYLDKGLKACHDFITSEVFADIEKKTSSGLKDPKSLLQEKVQFLGFRAPNYKVIKSFGPDHAKTFVVEVLINGERMATGKGSSKAIATKTAAKKALLRLASK